MSSSLSWFLKPVVRLLTALDEFLVYLATPFGVRVKDARKRYAILLGIYMAVFAVGALPVPVLPLLALAFGYVGVLAVGRAWVANEKERSLIAKRLRDGSPDDLPDLRGTALVSALQLLLLFPLIFMQAQRHFHLYDAPADTNLWGWVEFTLDSYNKAFLGLLDVYGFHVGHVGYGSTWGRHLVSLCRVTFDFLLIQAVVRLVAIGQTTREAVLAARSDPTMAVRLGRRAVGALIDALEDQDAILREGAARALGELRDPRAVEPLVVALQDTQEAVRSRAAEALGQLHDPRAVAPLIVALRDPDGAVRLAAAGALGRLMDRRAVEPLVAALQDTDHEVRRNAAVVLGELNDPRAIEPLVAALQDTQGVVRFAAAEALGKLKDPRAIKPFIAALQDTHAGVRWSAAQALGTLADPRAVEPLIAALGDADGEVRWYAAWALGQLNDLRAVQPLIAALKDVDGRVRDVAAPALKRLDPIAAGKVGVT